MRLNRLHFALFASASCAALAAACGGISDPTKGAGIEATTTAQVSGALTGTTVPANARVALVWRAPGAPDGYALGDDVPVVNGRFTMSLAAPPAAYFTNIDDSSSDPPTASPSPPQPPSGTTSSGGSSGGSSSGSPGGGSSSGGGGGTPSFGSGLSVRGAPGGDVGGSVTNLLSGAIAGFVVYADSNGNGKLDLAGKHAASTDEILGGNRELLLAYLKDGGTLDYEKLRDKAGVLPARGFNLQWDRDRWVPLNAVDLKLDPKQTLPRPVCEGGGDSPAGHGAGGEEANTSPAPPSRRTPSGTEPHPGPTDPNLHCAPDGRSYYVTSGTKCPTPTPQPSGLCGGADDVVPCASLSRVTNLPPGPVPTDWPCPIDFPEPALDAGPAPTPPDAGSP